MRFVCMCAVLCVTIVASAQSTDKDKYVKKPDTVTYSRSVTGDVLIECAGEKRYSILRFRAFMFPKEKGEDENWVACIDVGDRKPPSDHCAWYCLRPQSVTIRNVVLAVEKYDGNILFAYLGQRYELMKGKLPDPKEMRPQGTLKWKKSDGSHEYFHETCSDRVWKRYYWLDEKK